MCASRLRLGSIDFAYDSADEKSRFQCRAALIHRFVEFAQEKPVDSVDHLRCDVALDRQLFRAWQWRLILSSDRARLDIFLSVRLSNRISDEHSRYGVLNLDPHGITGCL